MFSSKLCDQDDFIDRYIKGEIPRYKNHLNLDEENIEKVNFIAYFCYKLQVPVIF
jgi:hypothetical protein